MSPSAVAPELTPKPIKLIAKQHAQAPSNKGLLIFIKGDKIFTSATKR